MKATDMSDQHLSFFFGGMLRTFRLHLPNGVKPLSPAPLIVMCHGGGANGDQACRQTGMNAQADRLGFVIAYPDGSGPASTGGWIWNAPPCFSTPIDDVNFVASGLPLHLHGLFGGMVDLTRVHVGGFSCGAILAWKAWREASDVVASFFMHSGDIGRGQLLPVPRFARPCLYIQGMTDTVCPLAGRLGPDDEVPCNHAPMSDGIDFACKTNLSVQPGKVQDITNANGTYHQTDWTGAAPVRAVTVEREGHNWTGGVPITKPANQLMSNAFSASEMVAEHCLPHSLGV